MTINTKHLNITHKHILGIKLTYDIFITESPELGQLLGHEQLGLPHRGQHVVPRLLRQTLVTQLLLKQRSQMSSL